MPHISLKMLKGRTEEQKKIAAQELTDALCKAIGCGPDHVSVSIQDYTAQEWQDIFAKEVTQNQNHIYKKPEYDPKDLL